MKHYGDITKIYGYVVPEVDVICGGSPCQDLSVAGKREGLSGERSGLFMEQIRIIKEMREAYVKANDNGRMAGDTSWIKPRYMVWENVPGAFSSNGGEDFRAVLEETAKVAEGDASIPRLEKWPSAGCIMGDGWSIAWRVHDAQFWGVPQRRKRISLVADFGGTTAPEILFERKGVSGDPHSSEEEGKGASGVHTGGVDETIVLNDQGGSQMSVSKGVTATLRTQEHQHQPLVLGSPCYGLDRASYNQGINAKYDISIEEEKEGPLVARGPNAVFYSVVRRLTPMECERLQGFPDGWTDIGDWIDSSGKKHRGDADMHRYKALGNSIALPFWQWMAERMVGELRRSGVEEPTMASLFDGIGGFPLVFSRCGCEPVWASEIEEFPIAVTKKHFPEVDDEERV